MSLIKWAPFLEPFEEMEKMLTNNRESQTGYVPAIDMYENNNKVIVEAQLANMDPEKISVSVENDILCIKGESEKKSEVEDKNYYRKEIRRGSFYRSIQLPAHVNGDKAQAVAEEGVLKISIPKIEESKPKTIEIKTKKK